MNLSFQKMDDGQKAMLANILCAAFDNQYSEITKEDILCLGKAVVGEHFQILPRYTQESGFKEEKRENNNFLGEIMQILRKGQVPISFVGNLAIQHLGFDENSSYAKSMKEITRRVEEDTQSRIDFNNVNPYHNEVHETNAMLASMALGKGENLSRENRALNAVIMAFHDHGHDSRPNEHESVENKSPDRLERLALKLMGVEEIEGKIHVSEDSPLRHLSSSEVDKAFQRVLDTVFPVNSSKVRLLYQAGEITEDIAARAVITAADLAESRTLVGNLENSVSVYRETAHAASITQNYKQARERFLGMLTSEKRAYFIQTLAPAFTRGEMAIGLFDENDQLAHHLAKKEEPLRLAYKTQKLSTSLLNVAKARAASAGGWAI